LAGRSTRSQYCVGTDGGRSGDSVDDPAVTDHHAGLTDDRRTVIDHRDPAIDATSGCALHRNPVNDHRAMVIAAR